MEMLLVVLVGCLVVAVTLKALTRREAPVQPCVPAPADPGRDPDGAALESVLERAVRVRVWSSSDRADVPPGAELLIDLDDAAALAELRVAFRSLRDKSAPADATGPTLELLDRVGARAALLVLGDGHTVYWSGWARPRRCGHLPGNWLALRGVPGPLEAFERHIRELKRDMD
ncbi:hypothetical protein [Nannocystis sp. SCPEA4]|uniref:hypothetical protein n=1 Tax=Nannocystis sp. SCPEA4 TaxID=2996787 RepID=UPI00226EF427|nr:hypothetical protein [Nannocystis sp. SCPEA4]MCY1059940.1 hypothetical protein [Nannocystis sp. SCPEA4]